MLAAARGGRAQAGRRSGVHAASVDRNAVYGDTLTARYGAPGAYEQVKVRSAAIDAPEKAQPFGQRSRQSLAALCHMQQATIHPRSTDRYGRTVADVECRGQDVARHQVARGMAWVFERYAKIVDAPLYRAQDVAQEAHRPVMRR